MASPQGLFWKRDDVKAALADVPEDAVAIQVQDLRVMMASLVETFVQLQAATAGEDQPKMLDVSARPDAEVIARHWGVAGSSVTRTPEGIFSSARFEHQKK